MTRLKGSKNKKPYPINAATITQRQSAVLSRGEKLTHLTRLCGDDEELKKIYRSAVVNVLQNPLMALSKQIAEVDVRMAKRDIRKTESDESVDLDEMDIKAIKLKTDAVKILLQAQATLGRNKRNRKVMGDIASEDTAIEADFENLIKG